MKTERAVPNAAVYVVPSSSGASTAYVPVHAKAAEPEKGIARYEGLSKSQTYGVNVYSKSTMATVQGLRSPKRKYVFVTIPSSKTYTTGVPIPGYTVRIGSIDQGSATR